MIIKKKSLYFVTLAVLSIVPISCITGDEQADPNADREISASKESQEIAANSALEGAASGAKDGESFAIASPITRNVVGKFPHLQGFEGDILIGNAKFQAVLAGVPLSRDSHKTYKGVHSLFLADAQNKWHKSKVWDSLEFRRVSSQGKTFLPIGLNFENDSDGHSFATLILAPSGKRSPQISLSFHIFKNLDWIVVENNVGKTSTKSERFWTARWRSDFGEQIIFNADKNASPYMIRFFDNEMVGYIGPTQSNTQVNLIPDTSFRIFDNNHKNSNVSHFFVGQKATASIPRSAQVHRTCLESFKVSGGKFALYKNVNVKAYISCFQKTLNLSENLTLTNEQDIAQRYFVLNEKAQKINYVHLPASSEKKIANQLQQKIQLESLVSSRRSPEVKGNDAQSIRALQKKIGSGRVFKPKDLNWRGPSLVRMMSHLAPNAMSVRPDWKLKSRGTNLWQNETWPLEFKLPIGYYRLEAFNLYSSQSCTAIVEVKEDMSSEVVCQPKAISSTNTFASNVDLAQQLHPFYEYLDVDNVDRGQSGIDKERQTIWATSAEHRIQFRVYPVEEQDMKNWNDLLEKSPSESRFDLLGQFSENLPQVIVKELLCPFTRTSKEALQSAIRRAKPNAIQSFGCENIAMPHAELLEEVRASGRTVPLLLPYSENNPLVPLSGVAKFISIDGNPSQNAFFDTDMIKTLSSELRYSLSRGALIKVNTPITNYIYIPQGRGQIEASFDLEVQALWPYRISQLEVVQSDGQSIKKDISISTGEYAITKFTTTVDSKLSWIQLNIRGRLIPQYPGLSTRQDEDYIIASSAPFIITREAPLNN